MTDTLGNEEPAGDAAVAPNGGDSAVQLDKGVPVETSTRIAKPSTSMMRKRPWSEWVEDGDVAVRSVACEECVRRSRERRMWKMSRCAGRKRFRMGRVGLQQGVKCDDVLHH